MNKDFAKFVLLASHPLSHGFENGPPLGRCSGTIVEYRENRLILTVAHAVQPDEAWAIELEYKGTQGMKLYRIGAMEYLIEVTGKQIREVDFSFTIVPQNVQAKWQQFSDQGKVVDEEERVILLSDLSSSPLPNLKYGFAGIAHPTSEPAPPGIPHKISGGEFTIETELTFIETVNGLDKYSLGKKHPGDDHYIGCSGAPLLSEDGDLVGLVVSGCELDSTINALPLRKYRSYIDVKLGLN